jgi:hypothetical protein
MTWDSFQNSSGQPEGGTKGSCSNLPQQNAPSIIIWAPGFDQKLA